MVRGYRTLSRKFKWKRERKMRSLIRILCLALLFTTVGKVQAGFITFNGTAPDGGFTLINPSSSYSEGGFNLQFGSGQQFFIDNDYVLSPFPILAGFDDDVLEFNDGAASFVLTNNSGLLFDFKSVIVSAAINEGGTGNFIFIGTLFGGGTISQTVNAFATSIDTIVFSGFTDLTSLTVTTSDGQFPFMDNLEVSVSAVPEPTTIALWGIGSLSMGLIARRRAKKVAAV